MGRFLLFIALTIAGCAGPAALTPKQWEYIRAHPELGDSGRNALLERAIAVGQRLDRVLAAWDGLRVERKPHQPGSRIDTYEFFVAIDGRPVAVRGPEGGETITTGRVLLTFRDEVLVSWVRLEYE